MEVWEIHLNNEFCDKSCELKTSIEEFYNKYNCNNKSSPLVKKWLNKIHSQERLILKNKFHNLYAKIEKDPAKEHGKHGCSLIFLLCVNAMKALHCLYLTSEENLEIFEKVIRIYDNFDMKKQTEGEALEEMHRLLNKLIDLEPELMEIVEHLKKDIHTGKTNVFHCELKSDDSEVQLFVKEYEDEAAHDERVNAWMEDVKSERHHLIDDFDVIYNNIKSAKLTSNENIILLKHNLAVLALKSLSGLELCSKDNLEIIDHILDIIESMRNVKKEPSMVYNDINTSLKLLLKPSEEVKKTLDVLKENLLESLELTSALINYEDEDEDDEDDEDEDEDEEDDEDDQDEKVDNI